MAGIGESVVAALTNDSAVAAMIGEQLYPADAVDENATVPYGEYVETDDDEDRTLEDTVVGISNDVTITWVTATYAQAKQLAKESRRVLNAMSGAVGGHVIVVARVQGTSDTPTGPVERDDQQVFQVDVTVGIYSQP